MTAPRTFMRGVAKPLAKSVTKPSIFSVYAAQCRQHLLGNVCYSRVTLSIIGIVGKVNAGGGDGLKLLGPC